MKKKIIETTEGNFWITEFGNDRWENTVEKSNSSNEVINIKVLFHDGNGFKREDGVNFFYEEIPILIRSLYNLLKEHNGD